MKYVDYAVWWRRHGAPAWSKTHHTLKARTDKEAQSRLRRMFEGSGFSGMSMVAVLGTADPNAAK